ncbi:unnamed protein product [Bursaphelenchus xylophilus]|uniref:Aminopeptidase n=1 Tax=Bursaphelenchus xylophilus TaxID=6326 RepID=A0A1I7RVL8_BURXY|nr:unnamed protein product [Bursaphelenchus xylophilus]CAG9081865.1 unnamed protein product [Bursaphelenchus xylophilus]
MTRHLLVLLFFCLCVFGLRPSPRRQDRRNGARPFPDVDNTNDSLPHKVEVYHYNLTLDATFAYKGYKFPAEKLNTFVGQVQIFLSPLQQINQIELNSAVNITSTHLTDGTTQYTITKQEHTAADHLIIHTKETLEVAKNYTLSFEFNGHFNKEWEGLYSVDITDEDHQETAILATQFEEIKARTAFPCFDDPSFKSTFQLTLYHPKGSKALNNAEALSHKDVGQQTITVFGITPKMPSYLFALAASGFYEVSAKTSRGVLTRVISIHKDPKFNQETAVYAAKIVDIMENLTGIEYPLEKLDHLDVMFMMAEGMENFGLITYNNKYLNAKYDENLVDQFTRINVIAHETSHQWFGNLVTGKRWGLEYLHESFANLFETEVMQNIDLFNYAVRMDTIKRFKDARGFAEKAWHAIEDKVSYFDEMTYEVGGALLLVIKNLVSEKVFYSALHTYLKNNSFGNADTDALAAAFNEALKDAPSLGFDFSEEYLKPYIRQVGIPTVNVTLNEQDQYVIQQITFQNSNTWLVPLFIYNLDKMEEIRVDVRKDPVTLNTTDTLLFNSNYKTFAFVNLDDTIVEKVVKHKNLPKLSAQNQVAVLSYEGREEEVLARIVEGNGYEVDPFAAQYLPNVNNKDLVTKLADKFILENTTEARHVGRHLLLRAVQLEVPKIVNLTQTLFDQFVKDCDAKKPLHGCAKIIPEYRYGVYTQGIKSEDGLAFLSNYHERLENAAYPEGQLFMPEYMRVGDILG